MRKVYVKSMALAIVFTFFSFTNLFAQNVSGVVTDENGEPLPGASVIVVGTAIGTTTDFDGMYSVDVREDAATNGEYTLEVVFMGYKKASKVFNISQNAQWNPQLVPDAAVLEDVVVVGYGTVKKEDKTGSVYSVTSKDIQTVAVQDPIEGIQGKIPGVTIRKGGSDPNAGFNVRIRGAASLASGNNPLYVVDGVVGVDPTTIAPEDIESFNVLKDASSAAIYGSRGANGVILITTKRGSKDHSAVEFSSYVTVDQIAARSRLDLMSADQYRAYSEVSGKPIRDLGFSTDWQDEIYRTGLTHNEALSFSGGNDKGSYRASVSNMDMQGIVNKSGKKRTIFRLNADTKAFDDKLKLTMNVAQTMEKNSYVNYGSSGADGVLFQAFQRNPTSPVYNEDGSFFQDPTPPVNNYSNPVAAIDAIDNTRDAKRFLANLKADLEIFEGFTFTVNTGYTRDDSESSYFISSQNQPLGGGEASRSYSNNSSLLAEAYATYVKSFNNNNFQIVGGYSYQLGQWDGFSARGRFPTSDITGADNLGSLTDVKPGYISSYRGESKLISGFARMVYDYDKKYFVTATVRRDGSSRFGANHRWGIFPSGSVAWNMKKEGFLENVDFISQLKPRVGFGQTGNQEIGDYNNIALFGSKTPVLNPETGDYSIPYDAFQNPNPNLKWEVNTEIGVGIDFGFLADRFSGSIDFFKKRTTDLINYYPVDEQTNLVSTTLANGGTFDINGVEFVLTTHVFDNETISWYSTISATHTRAVVVSLGTDDLFTPEYVLEGYLQEPLGYGTASQILLEGQQQGIFFGPKYVGVDSRTGKQLFAKADGTFQTIDNIEFEDHQIIGYTQPDLELGWSNSMTLFQNIDVNFTWRGMFGHDILNATYMVFDNPNYYPTRNVLNSATERNIVGPSTFSDYWLEKGNFFRLENITIGYNFNTSNIDWLGNARLFVTGNNLWTITNYNGIDPSTIGIDIFNVYPKSTSFTLGFNMSF